MKWIFLCETSDDKRNFFGFFLLMLNLIVERSLLSLRGELVLFLLLLCLPFSPFSIPIDFISDFQLLGYRPSSAFAFASFCQPIHICHRRLIMLNVFFGIQT